MGWVVKGTPQPLYRREMDVVPIVPEAGWAQGRSGRVRKISLSHQDSIPGPFFP
jgi:hypothetical protein